LVFTLALLVFNFTVVGKYASYPWWHQHDCDSDPLYVAQAVTLVNDGPFDYIHHPGAVVSSGHGFAYRLAAAVTGWHPEYLDIRASQRGFSPWEVLEDATRFSRWLSFAVFAAFVATFCCFVFWLTRNGVVTSMVTFFVATSPVAIWHSRAVRPEVPSLLCSLLALWAVLASARGLARGEDRRLAAGSVVLGIVLALAMMSKIQVLPVAAALLVLGFGLVIIHGDPGNRNATTRRLRASLVLGVIVVVMTPWWALGKPEFLTEAHLESIGYFDRLVYGSLPESFVPLAAGLLGMSLAGTVAAMIINRRRSGTRTVDRLARAFVFLHLAELGATLGVYAVVAPTSRTFSSYLGNTHHLVYATIANTFGNVFERGFLLHKTVDRNTLMRVFDTHALGDRLLGVNIAWLIIAVSAVVAARVLTKSTADRGEYRLVLFLLAIGAVMDVIFTLRWSAQFNYYVIYSLVFYGIGLALYLELEWRNLWLDGGRLRATSGVAILLAGLLVSHVGYRTWELVTAPRATGISEQTPVLMLESIQAQNPNFWIMFEESP
jgi:hypothetical protein